MKCEYCSGNISLEDERCPYCGRINEQARKHIQDMQRYQGSFESTQRDVYAVTGKYKGIMVKLIFLAILIIMSVIMLFIQGQSYGIRRAIGRTQARVNAEKYKPELDEFLSAGDYIGLSSFCDSKYIYMWDDGEYAAYIAIIRESANYKHVVESIAGIAVMEEDSDRYTDELEFLADYLNNYYECLNMDRYEYYDIDIEMTQKAFDDMNVRINALLKTYCNFTDEDLKGLSGLSKSKIAVLLEERINYGE